MENLVREDGGAGLLDVRTANEWLREAKRQPVPKQLFGPMWLEGELAIMFADTAMGKSVLAVQIADAIARGRAATAAPLEMEARAQTVLYFDFELSAKQFEMRYASVRRSRKDEFLKNHYRFSQRFRRVEIDLNARLENGFRSFDEFLLSEIERLVRQGGARVLIIDNITYLKRSGDGTRDAVALIKRLTTLKRRYGLSILALAHTSRRRNDLPITANDLRGSKVLSDFADNIFAIGQSRLEPATRYIKHLKPRSSRLRHHSGNVLSFRISWLEDNFLGFAYLGPATEAEHLDAGCYTADQEAVATIRELAGRGKSVRKIASQLGLSKSKVHRLLHVWGESQVRNSEVQSSDGAARGATPRSAEPEYGPSDFPGCEEYDEAAADPRFDEAMDKDDEESSRLNRLSWLIEYARGRAHDIYLETGQAPPLAADPEYAAFLAGEEEYAAFLAREQEEKEKADAPSYAAEPSEAAAPPPAEPSPFNPPLPSRTDANGDTIYIESEQYDGKPIIWYKFDRKGQKMRYQRDVAGILVTRMPSETAGS